MEPSSAIALTILPSDPSYPPRILGWSWCRSNPCRWTHCHPYSSPTSWTISLRSRNMDLLKITRTLVHKTPSRRTIRGLTEPPSLTIYSTWCLFLTHWAPHLWPQFQPAAPGSLDSGAAKFSGRFVPKESESRTRRTVLLYHCNSFQTRENFM